MNQEIINLQAKRVEVEIHFLSAKVANSVDQLESALKQLIELQQALEELYLSIGDPEA